MKHQFKAIGLPNHLEIHLDTEVTQNLLSKIEKVAGVNFARKSASDKYVVALYKGELFEWASVKEAIAKVLG